MNTRRLRLLARLMFKWELLRAINWRDHSPDYRSISKNLEARVDRTLGFDCAPVFSSGDDFYTAVLKSSRNRIIAENLHSVILDTIGSHSFEHITSNLRQALNEEVMRLNQRIGIRALAGRNDGFLNFLLLAGYYAARRIMWLKSLFLRQLRECWQAWTRQREFWKGCADSIGRVRRDTRQVMMLIRIDWPQIGYSTGKIVRELQQAGTSVCCLVAEGLDPTRSPVLPHGWDWLREVEAIYLPRIPYPLWGLLTGLLIPEVPKRYHARGLRKFPSIPGIRSKPNRYLQEFVFAANYAHFLIDSIRPRSVLNMASDKNIYGQAVTYCCLKGGLPIHTYYPLILYPNGMQPTWLTPSILLVSKLDVPSSETLRSGRSYSVVGSPLFNDLPRPNVEKAPDRHHDLRLIYFTKRVFPNLEVISNIKQTLDKLGRKFHLVIKAHPTDTASDYKNLISILRESKYTYVEADEIESVDEWIARSDIVISGPSNVIWNALRERKHVIYLNFIGIGNDYYPEAYGRYATAPFMTARAVLEVGDQLKQILNETDGWRTPAVDQAKFQALMEDIFHAGAGSARRIADLLTQSAERPPSVVAGVNHNA